METSVAQSTKRLAPPLTPSPDGEDEQEVGDFVPDDLSTLPGYCFSDYTLPDLSVCTFYTENFNRRLGQFMSMYSAAGPLFALTRVPPTGRWVRLDNTYRVLTLRGKHMYFWGTAFVNVVSLNDSEDNREPLTQFTLGFFGRDQATNLAGLMSPYFPDWPWQSTFRVRSVAGFENVADHVYDARTHFLFSDRLPQLSTTDVRPGDIVVSEFLIVEKVVDGRTIRELHATRLYLIWSNPRTSRRYNIPVMKIGSGPDATSVASYPK